MLAELGNFFVILPYMFFSIAGILVIFFVLRERKGPSIPNLTARRKHPLRQFQVGLNRAKKTAQDKATAERGEDASAEDAPKPKRAPRRDDGPGRLRRLK